MASEATKTDDGGPAFPVPMIPCDREGGYTSVQNEGISVRDYFAAVVNVDEFSPSTASALAGPMPDESDVPAMVVWAAKANAKLRYALADAMLAARKETRP